MKDPDAFKTLDRHRARKRFGQNFLHDPLIIQRIIHAIAPERGQHLVEIGPGLGAITRALLEAAGELDVIEIDRDLIPRLKVICAGLGELRIHARDVLKFDFSSLIPAPGRVRVIGNLPYNISTPLLFHLYSQRQHILDMHVMLQKEVAERLAASPGSKDYGRLSIMSQYYCAIELLFSIGPQAFRPAPKVDSAFVRLVPHSQPPVQVDDEKLFALLVNQAFTQRRKTIRNALKGWLSAEDIEGLGIDAGLRPEVLSLAQFAQLSNAAARKIKRP